MSAKLGDIWLAHSLRIRLGIPSVPEAFDGCMSWSSFSAPFSLMVSFGMDSSIKKGDRRARKQREQHNNLRRRQYVICMSSCPFM
jgi:hypothetical protein